MTLYLVRHAKAVGRSAWDREERLRPLTPGGHRQAMRLVETLGDAHVTRIVSSPFLRCRQTLEPLAAQRGLPLEIDARLAEGARLDAALALARDLADEVAVLCGHGDLIPQLVARLCRDGFDRDDRLECEKGSIWVLEGPPKRRATYIPAPARRSGSAPALRDWPGRRAPGPLHVDRLLEGEDEEGAKERVAVLDLGSTSFHLLVADASPFGDIQRVVRERVMLRLGAVMAGERRVPADVCKRAVKTARALCDVAREAKVDRLLPVATAALREAENGPELAERISRAVGEPVRILSGEEEARLMFAAFRRRVPLARGATLGVDLGGGSLELALGDADRVGWETTLPLGVARLHGELVRSNPMSKREARAVCERVRDRVGPCRKPIARRRPAGCVATGGTVGALARLIAARRTSWPRRTVSQLFVPIAELDEVADALVASSHEERLRMRGMARQRVDLLPTGALVLASLAEALGLEGFTVSDWGLREGVILEALGLAHSGRRRQPRCA